MIRRLFIFSSDQFKVLPQFLWRFQIDGILIFVLLFVVIGETGLRLFTSAFPDHSLTVDLQLSNEGFKPPPHVFDPETGYRYRAQAESLVVRRDYSNLMRTNNFGFKDQDFVISPPSNTTRVAVLGESYLAANQVKLDEGWAHLLERQLPEIAEKHVEIMNFGIDGYLLWNMKSLLKVDVIKFSPDLVIVWGFRESMSPKEKYRRTTESGRILVSTTKEALRAAREPSRSLGKFLMYASYLSRAAIVLSGRKLIVEPQSALISSVNESLHPVFETLKEIQILCRKAGIALAVIFRGQPPPKDQNSPARLMIPYASDGEVFPNGYRGLGWPHDGHFDIEGNAEYARRMAPIFTRLITQAVSRK